MPELTAQAPDFDRETAHKELTHLLRVLDRCDISTFKEKVNHMLVAVDLRDDDDMTDFSFLNRRSTDE